MNEVQVQREAAGLTRAQLAEKSGVSVVTIWRTETGKHSPTLAVLGKLAAALKVPVKDLLDEDPAA